MSYKIYKEFPILYGTEKNGKVKMWKTSVYFEENGDKAMSIIEFGQIDGKKQIANREYIEGKNIGKKNQTTPLQQCLNETQKKWTDKKEKDSYREANDNKDSKQENYDNKER